MTNSAVPEFDADVPATTLAALAADPMMAERERIAEAMERAAASEYYDVEHVADAVRNWARKIRVGDVE